MQRQLRSGRSFSPYFLDTPVLNTPTNLDLTPHLKAAVTLEDSRALDEEDDSEGATLSLEALEDELSELTPLEETDEEDTRSEPGAQAAAGPVTNVAPRGQVEAMRRKDYDKARRQKARARSKAARSTLGTHKVKASISQRYARPMSTPSAFDADDLPHAQGAYIGRRLESFRPEPWTVEELIADGYEYQPWDGRCARFFNLGSYFVYCGYPTERLARLRTQRDGSMSI
jgi:hypothetical protein